MKIMRIIRAVLSFVGYFFIFYQVLEFVNRNIDNEPFLGIVGYITILFTVFFLAGMVVSTLDDIP